MKIPVHEGKLMRGNPRQIWDFVDLFLLKLAKRGRVKLMKGVSQEQFYEEFFTENDAEMFGAGGDLRRKYRAEVLQPAAWARMPRDARVIDIGCGTGDNLRYIIRDDATFFGIEYARETAAIATRTLGARAEIRVGSAAAMPYRDGHFDFAMCIEVLEHMEQDERALGEIARVLRPGGSLIITLPYRYWFASYFPLMGHFRHYTRSYLVNMLNRHGFVVSEYLPNFPNWSRFANYCYITCRLYAYALRVVGIRRAAYEVTLPWSRRKLLDQLFALIEPMRRQEARRDYSSMETSTFIAATRVNGGDTLGVASTAGRQ
jgi:SAM-dependent methyltransferase